MQPHEKRTYHPVVSPVVRSLERDGAGPDRQEGRHARRGQGARNQGEKEDQIQEGVAPQRPDLSGIGRQRGVHPFRGRLDRHLLGRRTTTVGSRGGEPRTANCRRCRGDPLRAPTRAATSRATTTTKTACAASLIEVDADGHGIVMSIPRPTCAGANSKRATPSVSG